MIPFFVRDLAGRSMTMRVSPLSTIGQLKVRLEQRIVIPTTQQRLIYRTETQDPDTLQEIGLAPNGTNHLSILLNGGMETDGAQEQVEMRLALHDNSEIHFSAHTETYQTARTAATSRSQAYRISYLYASHPALRVGQKLTKIDALFCDGKDPSQIAAILAGPPNTNITLSLQNPGQPPVFQVTLTRQSEIYPLTPPHNPTSHLGSPRATKEDSALELPENGSPPSNTNPPRLPQRNPNNRPAGGSGSPLPHLAPPQTDKALLSEPTWHEIKTITSALCKLSENDPTRYISQKDLAQEVYKRLGGPATFKTTLQARFGPQAPFTKFLQACSHQNGTPLLQWKVRPTQELRISYGPHGPNSLPLPTTHPKRQCLHPIGPTHSQLSPQPTDMNERLNATQERRTQRQSTAHVFKYKQDYHVGDFIYIRNIGHSQSQLVRILHATTPTRAVPTKVLPWTITAQPWTNSDGKYLSDKSANIEFNILQDYRLQTTAYPDTSPDTPFFEHAVEFFHLTYLDLLLCSRVSTT